jgi:2,4-dienoyl-CoA reductase-like NADH-dependent reductase (Old Yellow Enzyme family)
MSASQSSIEVLFQPFQLRKLTLRNRLVMAPMTRCFSPSGIPGPEVAQYYRRRAAAGVGLVTTEGTGIDHEAAVGAGTMNEQNVPTLHGTPALAGWKAVVDAVHGAGGLIFPQLWHMGAIRVPGTGPSPGAPSCRPSGLWGPEDARPALSPSYLEGTCKPTSPMTESAIGEVIAAYARSATNANSVGFDGIAIHGAHGYLIDSFLWHGTNRRTDRYGGSVSNRSRFAAEVVRSVRAAVGPDLPIVFRYSQWKLQDYDARLAETPHELEQLLGPLAEAGVDLFEASTRIFWKPAFAGSSLTLAGWTRKLTGKPSMAVGGIGLDKDLQSSFTGPVNTLNNLANACERLQAGEFDLLAVGRSMLVDPEWILKARHGLPFKPFALEAFAQLY